VAAAGRRVRQQQVLLLHTHLPRVVRVAVHGALG
jgi:hypothetical protein